MGDETLTVKYETLFDLLRREKNKEELQELPQTFFQDANLLVHEKEQALRQQGLSFDDVDKLTHQLRNMKKIIEELYHRREKKIMDIALIKSRIRHGIVTKKAMLPHEESLFEQMSTVLQEYKQRSVIGDKLPVFAPPIGITAGIAPKPAVQQPLQPIPAPSPVSQVSQMEESTLVQVALAGEGQIVQEHIQQPPTPVPEPKAFKTSPILAQDRVPVRFLGPMPKFVGPELEIYGPYAQDDQASLPKQVADILLEKGKAEKVAS
ncbi:DNA replication complex GINS family protein [Candidatus Woesearchaeota archaeon]|nr:DNA replication complex GINS family protein [Candidatus Woesearchaeota archaeon]